MCIRRTLLFRRTANAWRGRSAGSLACGVGADRVVAITTCRRPVQPSKASSAAATTRSCFRTTPAAGSDFSPQETYGSPSDSRFVSGDLGSFWSGEMAWSAGQQTLVVGPVPETAPGLPVAMSLRFDGDGARLGRGGDGVGRPLPVPGHAPAALTAGSLAGDAARNDEGHRVGGIHRDGGHRGARDDHHLSGEVVGLRKVDRHVVRTAEAVHRIARDEADRLEASVAADVDQDRLVEPALFARRRRSSDP